MRVKIPRKPHKDGHCKPSEAHSGRMTKIDMKPSKALKSPQKPSNNTARPDILDVGHSSELVRDTNPHQAGQTCPIAHASQNNPN
jgi:hypothetical protein